MKLNIVSVSILALVLMAGFFYTPLIAQAALTETGPPMDELFKNQTAGGGSIIPLTRFLLTGDGATTLTKIGFILQASSTMTSPNEIAGIGLYKESNAHPGFQFTEDTLVAGAYKANPATSTLQLLQPTGGLAVATTPTEFFIVASTSATSNIINGDGFHIELQAGYASTSAGAIGTAFTATNKITLDQSSPIKISEMRLGTTGNTEDEFIELYNTTDFPIDLQKLPLNLHIFDAAGGAGNKALTYYNTIIPDFGFFLIGSQTNYSGSVPLDAVYLTVSGNTLIAQGGFSIATSSVATNATSTDIDLLCWGSQPASNCEGANPQLSNLALDSSLERKATSTADASSQYQNGGGPHATKGNGSDVNNNDADFVVQTVPVPQNANSPSEFAFGGEGFTDSGAPRVLGGWPPHQATGIPPDITYLGFELSEPVATGTINSAAATTTVTLIAQGGSTNLCTSVSYTPNPTNYEPQAKCFLSASLVASTQHTFTVTSNVRDVNGNQLDQDSFTPGNQSYAATFTTGSSAQSFMNQTPPFVIGASPFWGSQNVPTNIKKIVLEFSTEMKPSTLNATNITLSGVDLSGQTYTFSSSTGKNILTITLSSNLTANTSYTLTITQGVQSINGISLPFSDTVQFTTGSGADTTAPTVSAVLPAPGTTIPVATGEFVVVFDDDIDTTTATSGAVTLGVTGGSTLPATVLYDAISKELLVVPTNLLPINLSGTLELTVKGASIRNVSNTQVAANVVRKWSTEATNSDATAPSILFANADSFNVAVTFDEPVNEADAINLSNYTVSTDGTSVTLAALAGQKVEYDAIDRTARIIGIHLSGTNFTVTVSNIKDRSGNKMAASASFTGPLKSFSSSSGFVGPGEFTGSTFGTEFDFSSSGIGFMPPVGIFPMSNFVKASTTYMFDIPLQKRIPANGTIVITFPSTADFNICCAATTSTKNPFLAQENADINGPGAGTIGIKTITKNATSKTITITLDTATRSESGDVHDFLHFALDDIKNPSIGKSFDTSGYIMDIKSKDDSGTLLESFTANPIFIMGASDGGATTTIRGTVSGNGANLQGVTIHMMSPQTGPMDATTNSSGLYQFEDMPVNTQFLTNNFGMGGEYYLFTDPIVLPTTGTTTAFFGVSEPRPITATSTSFITRNFALTSTSSAVNLDIQLTASANTFSAGEQVDVFAGGTGDFVVRTVTPGTGALTASTITTISIPQKDGNWWIGIGPAMPKGGNMGFSGPPPAPNWVMPKPAEVTISGCPSACLAKIDNVSVTSKAFTITAADKTISGVLKDESGNAISNAMVYAYSPSAGIGNHGESSAVGVFSIKVTNGSYVVGAHSPEVGNSREVSVVVDSSGNVYVDGSPTASTGSSGSNPFTLKMTTPAYTIKGKVTDGTNAVGNAPVFAYRTDAPGHADAMTDSSTGNYTLRVDNGTWKVNALIPGFGQMNEQTIIISGASVTDKDFSPSSSSNYSVLSGNIYEDATGGVANQFDTGEGIEGAIIRVAGASGTNEAVSGTDGAYALRVISGTGYQISDIFEPNYGRIAPLKNDGTAIGTINLTASTTQNIRVGTRQTVTINFKDSGGSALEVQEAFIDLFDTTTMLGNHIEVRNATTTSLKIATGASTTVRVFIPGVPSGNIAVASDHANTLVLSGVVQVNGAEVVKITVNTTLAPLSAVSGTTYHTSATAGNELEDVWLQFIDATNGIHLGTVSTTSGKYSVKVSDGTYTVIPGKPGYVGVPVTLTVSGATAQNFTLTKASQTITGQVTAGGSAAKEAFVWAHKVGGGDAISSTDSNGNYTLNVTEGSWKVSAVADGYAEGAYSGNPASAGAIGVNIALSTTVSLDSLLATSNTFTDTAAGSLKDTTLGVEIELDTGALGSAGSSAYMTAQETSNFPRTSSVTIVGTEAVDIDAFSGSSKVTNLSSGKTATVDLTYTKAELATSNIDTTSEVSALKVVSYSETLGDWESLSTVATYLDSAGAVVTSPSSDLSNVSSVAFTSVGTHFSVYALSNPTDGGAPSTPSSVTATAGAKGSGEITVSWGSVSGATGYFVYRDTDSSGSFALLTDAGNVTSYTNSGVTNGATYYYKVSAYKSSGASESSASSAVNAIVEKGGGGGVVGVTTGGGGGGGALGPYAAPQTSTATTTTTATTTSTTSSTSTFATPATPANPTMSTAVPATPSPSAQPSPVALLVSPVFNSTLKPGTIHADVKRLQELLNSDPDTRIAASGVGSPGNETDYFGAMTRKAVEKFQIKHGIVSSGSPETTGFGSVGPATRAKLEAVFSKATPSAPTVAQPSGTAMSVSPVFNRGLDIGATGEDVKRLQELLNRDPDTRIATSGVGSPGSETTTFGSLTKAAVAKFQMKYGLVTSASDVGYGYVGPKTRAKLMEVFSAGQPSQTSTAITHASDLDAAAKTAIEQQIQSALQQIQKLQADLNAQGGQ